MKQQILRYWLAMNASAFDSAIHALVLFCGVAGTHQVMDAVPALNVNQLITLFFIAFGRAVLAYLDGHPVSDFYKKIGGGSPATTGTVAEPTAAPVVISEPGPLADQGAAGGAPAAAREARALPEIRESREIPAMQTTTMVPPTNT